MGQQHKLLLPLGHEPVIRRTVRAVLGAGPEETVVVTGCNSEPVTRSLAGLEVRVRFNSRHEEGQMTSVAAGVSTLAAQCDAVMVCLGDMPALDSDDYRALAQAWAARPRGSILVPQRDGVRGNPVVFDSRLIPEVAAGNCNPGCRRLIADRPEEVHGYDPGHDRCFVDLDTPDDYARLCARLALPAQGALLAG